MPDITDIRSGLWKVATTKGKEPFWTLPYFPAVGKGKVITLGKAAAKPSYEGVISGAMPQGFFTTGGQQLLGFAEPTYKSVSKLMPSALKGQFPYAIFISSQSSKAFYSALGTGVFAGGVRTLPHLAQASISEIERQIRQPFKPRVKPTTVKIPGFRSALVPTTSPAIANALKQSMLDINALMDFSITGTAQTQAQAQKQAQTTLLEQTLLQKTKQMTKAQSLQKFRFPFFIFFPPRIGGHGRRYLGRDLWGLEYRYREFKIRDLFAIDKLITKNLSKTFKTDMKKMSFFSLGSNKKLMKKMFSMRI